MSHNERNRSEKERILPGARVDSFLLLLFCCPPEPHRGDPATPDPPPEATPIKHVSWKKEKVQILGEAMLLFVFALCLVAADAFQASRSRFSGTLHPSKTLIQAETNSPLVDRVSVNFFVPPFFFNLIYRVVFSNTPLCYNCPAWCIILCLYFLFRL